MRYFVSIFSLFYIYCLWKVLIEKHNNAKFITTLQILSDEEMSFLHIEAQSPCPTENKTANQWWLHFQNKTNEKWFKITRVIMFNTEALHKVYLHLFPPLHIWSQKKYLQWKYKKLILFLLSILFFFLKKKKSKANFKNF